MITKESIITIEVPKHDVKTPQNNFIDIYAEALSQHQEVVCAYAQLDLESSNIKIFVRDVSSNIIGKLTNIELDFRDYYPYINFDYNNYNIDSVDTENKVHFHSDLELNGYKMFYP